MIIIRSCCNYFCALLLFDTFQSPFGEKKRNGQEFKKVFPKDPMITDIADDVSYSTATHLHK
jgi:hypothetical protein